MLKETNSYVYHVCDASGIDYVLVAKDMGDAFQRFKNYIADADNPDDWEDPQSIGIVGAYLIEETETDDAAKQKT